MVRWAREIEAIGMVKMKGDMSVSRRFMRDELGRMRVARDACMCGEDGCVATQDCLRSS